MEYSGLFLLAFSVLFQKTEGTFAREINECFTPVEATRSYHQTNTWIGLFDQKPLRACMAQCLSDSECAAVLHYSNRGRCVPVDGDAEVFRDRDVVQDLSFVFIKRPGSTLSSCSILNTITVSPTPLYPRRLPPSSPLRNRKDIVNFVQSLTRLNSRPASASTTVPALDMGEVTQTLEPLTTTTTSPTPTSRSFVESDEEEIDVQIPEGVEFAGFEATVQLTEGPSSVPDVRLYNAEDDIEELLRVEEFAEPAGRTRALAYENCTRPIAFSATVTQAYNITSPSSSRVIVFDDVTTNIGGFYNAELGNFSPPCAGVFSFTVDLSSQRGTLASVHLMHNERVILPLRANGRFTGDSGTASGTALVELSESDHVFVVLVYDRGYTYVLPGYTRFSGFMV